MRIFTSKFQRQKYITSFSNRADISSAVRVIKTPRLNLYVLSVRTSGSTTTAWGLTRLQEANGTASTAVKCAPAELLHEEVDSSALEGFIIINIIAYHRSQALFKIFKTTISSAGESRKMRSSHFSDFDLHHFQTPLLEN